MSFESSKRLNSETTPSGGRGAFTLHLADNALILGHRNSEWCGHGPVLEQDIAITNISLDLIGQARNFYQYAARLVNDSQKTKSLETPPSEGLGEASEDKFAYFRDGPDFKNVLLVELPKGDWAFTILRQFLFSAYQYLLFEKLKESKDMQIAAIAAKSIKETTYHLRWSSEWVIRLGDGTEESHTRIKKALLDLWGYTEELFIPAEYELEMAGNKIGIDISLLKEPWLTKVETVFTEAALSTPSHSDKHTGGKNGQHSGHLASLLSEMQSVTRAFPGCNW